MKKNLVWLLLTFTLLALDAAHALAPLNPLPQQSRAAHLSADVLTRYHYKRIPLDDASSAKIFDNYLKALDGEKIFLSQV